MGPAWPRHARLGMAGLVWKRDLERCREQKVPLAQMYQTRGVRGGEQDYFVAAGTAPAIGCGTLPASSTGCSSTSGTGETKTASEHGGSL